MISLHPVHAFLAGTGRDGRGRTIEDVLAFSDREFESVHDYIQWLFPLPTPSAAQPGAPVVSRDEVAAIRADEAALANFRRAADRMLRFYRETRAWLTFDDHNHLRISRILQALRLLLGDRDARDFFEAIVARHQAEGSPVNPRNVAYWKRAVE